MAFVVAVLALAATSATANGPLTWSGAATDANWSDGTNWGGSAPSNPVTTLSFPSLTSCTPPATCYTSNNNVPGLDVNALSFDILNSYGVITGDAITLGGGGLNGTTTGSGGQNVSFGFPITLSAPQTWTLSGAAAVTLEAAVTGTTEGFTLDTSGNATLGVSTNMEVGTANIDSGGSGGSGAVVYGSGSVLSVEGELNATDGNGVNVNDSSLETVSGGGASGVGPLAVTNGDVYIGDPGPGYTGILHVSGGATFDSSSFLGMYVGSAGTTAGTDYDQLSATGTVDLGGVQFALAGNAPGGACLTLNPGDVMTLITTTGTLTGTFNGVPNGTIVSVNCDGGSGTPPTVTINYTAHTVTATVTGAGTTPPPTTTTTPPSTPGKLGSSTSVSCTLDTDTTVDCGATVSAGSGTSTPTGNVVFSSGGAGTLLGSVCALSPVPFVPGSASCTLKYMPPDSSNSVVTAAYQGDGTFNPSSGSEELIPVKMDETDCDDGCSNNQVTFQGEELPGQTTQSVTTKNGTNNDEDYDDNWDFDFGEKELQEAADAGAAEDMAEQLGISVGDIDGAPSVSASQAASIGSDLDQVTSSASNAGTLNTIDTSTAPAFPSDTDSGGGSSDGLLQRASAASVGSAPEASLVLESIDATHPTAAEIAAFNEELALATAPTHSPARGLARLTLLIAEDVGFRVIAHDLGYKRVTQLRKTIVLGSVRGRLKKHATTTLTIKASALGGRLLRVLDIVGLSQNLSTQLKVSISPAGKHQSHTITTTTKIL